MHLNTIKIALLYGCLLSLFAFGQDDLEKIVLPSVPAQKTITVWIHGTRLVPGSFFKKFFYCHPGLNRCDSLTTDFRQRRIADDLIASSANLFNKDDFYLFGWSGTLSCGEREKAAHQLYKDLERVRDAYILQYQQEPFIRIIAHSHGGNVALLLEKVRNPEDTQFHINQLILLATPVQNQTMQYATSDLFGTVYLLYSLGDAIQVIDPQGFHNRTLSWPLFSQRKFPTHRKIKQIAIKIDERSLNHMEFIHRRVLQHLCHIITHMDTWPESERQYYHRCIKIRTQRSKGPRKKFILERLYEKIFTTCQHQYVSFRNEFRYKPGY